MNRTLLFVIITIVSFTACKTETKKEESIKTEKVKKIDETEKIEKAFTEFKSLYRELSGFKDNAEFKKLGFGKGGKYSKWLEKVRGFKQNPDSKLLLKKGVLIGELEQLGMAYASSKGKETEVTKTFNKIFSDVISPKTKLNESSTSESWYSGGNLHKADGTEWKKASEHNKLATCADFVMTIAKRNGEIPSVFSFEYKKASESLKDCIDHFYKLSGRENTTVTKAAIKCKSEI